MANLIQQLSLLASVFPDSDSHIFVSIYESNSQDATGRWLRVLQEELKEMGVPSAVVAGGAKRRVGEEDRIQFLSRMRNEAMRPLYEMQEEEEEKEEKEEGREQEEEEKGLGQVPQMNRSRRGLSEKTTTRTMTSVIKGNESSSNSSSSNNSSSSSNISSLAIRMEEKRREGGKEKNMLQSHPRRQMRGRKVNRLRRFDNVVFVNDVYFCAYEVLRLLLYNADLACGLDLFLEPYPDKHPETAALRKELTFYDLWVARDEEGQRFQWGPPFVRHVRGQARAGDGERRKEVEYEDAFPVFCCWNGLAVLDAKPFYRGLRFRSVRPGEGVVSECTNVCTDLWVNGHRKVVVDPQIKLAYDEPTYERLYAQRPPRYPDLYKVDREIDRVVEAPRTVETCHLNTGWKKEGSMVDFEDCRGRPLEEVLAGGIKLDRLCYDADGKGDDDAGDLQVTETNE